MTCVPLILGTAFLFVRLSLSSSLARFCAFLLPQAAIHHSLLTHTGTTPSTANPPTPQGTHTPALPLKPHALLTRLHLPLNLGTLAAATYSTLYVLLSPNVAGVAATPLVMGLASASNYLCTRFNKTKVTAGAVALHTISWILQFVGHGKYEGRKPALLDNLAQALFLAPLFVWYEVLFRLGFYKELHADIMRGVEEEVARMEARKGKGAVKGKGDK